LSRTILVLPAFNESTTIIDVLQQSDPYCDLVLAVDDGSEDQTRDLLTAYARLHPKLLVVSHQTNRGVSGAMLTAFLLLREGVQRGTITVDDVVVTMDTDGQHDAADIPQLVEPVRQGVTDMVLGRRSFDKYPLVKRIGNWGLSVWASLWSGSRYYDAECGFRAISVALLMDMLMYFNPSHYGFAQEMAVIASRRQWRVLNNVPIQVLCYRVGARVMNGFNNAASAIRAYRRVRASAVVHHEPLWPEVLLASDAADYGDRYRRWEVQDVL
jgi:glycosyltransferase involved in cell wall biosynthesis